ncbi:MAG: hypothetical protein ACJ752_04385 [Gaiellaceae bacterium]
MSALLIVRTEVKTHLRRVACLDIDLANNGKLHAPMLDLQAAFV